MLNFQISKQSKPFIITSFILLGLISILYLLSKTTACQESYINIFSNKITYNNIIKALISIVSMIYVILLIHSIKNTNENKLIGDNTKVQIVANNKQYILKSNGYEYWLEKNENLLLYAHSTCQSGVYSAYLFKDENNMIIDKASICKNHDKYFIKCGIEEFVI